MPTEIMAGWLSVMMVVSLMTLIQIVIGNRQVNTLPDTGISRDTPTLANLSIGLVCAISFIAAVFVNAGRNIGYGGAVVWGLIGMYLTSEN